MVTQPWGFENIESMNRWAAQFERQAEAICSRFSVLYYFDTIKLHKDPSRIEVSILRIGQYISGSAEEKACTEIIKLFNSQ